MIVYLVTNKINGKQYVGRTVKRLEQRWAGHCCAANKGSTLPLHNAIRKYGRNAFSLEVVAITRDAVELSQLEIQWIERTRSAIEGYNLTTGGEGAIGYKHTPEALAKMRSRLLGTKRSAEDCRKISEGQTGIKKISKNNWEGIRLAQSSRVRTPEERIKIGSAMRGKMHSEETKLKMRESRLRYFDTHPEAKQIPEITRQKALAAQFGSKRSEETREKMRMSQQLRRNKEKEVRSVAA